MKHRLLAALSGCIILWASSFLVESAAQETEPTWLSDYDKARVVARQTGKPLLVVFR